MTTVLKSVTIVDPKGAYHHQCVDIHLKDGLIHAIGENLPLPQEAQVIELPNAFVSPGWFDTSVVLGEPGFEAAETIANGLQTAASSGFTEIMVQPHTLPVADNAAVLHLLHQKASGQATAIHPIGALTMGSAGQALAELYDMQQAGAIAFGDYKKSMKNANLFKIALQYVQDFNGRVLAYCEDDTLRGNGVVNEGITATRLGLKGIPSLAEELQVARNLFLLEYTGGALHIPTLSTAKSVALVREAKARGLNVTCSVAVAHLVLTDGVLESFDTRYKLSPPLRTAHDREALWEGLRDNTIDCITTDHHPVDIEYKKVEFDLAHEGSIGLESAWGALAAVLSMDLIVEKLTAGRAIFGLPLAVIAPGAAVNLTLFTTEESGTFTADQIRSTSKNAALLGQPTRGKVLGIAREKHLMLN
ncbi:dihydroorotase [Flavobacterium sp.]|uniref:dihydroorotase n=1 Tax=Flavobacterium sp. TaxID=239 RepID=UPI003342C3C5